MNNESEKHLMLVMMILACNHLFFFAVKAWIQNKMPVQIHTSILVLNQEEVTALTHQGPPVCAVGDQFEEPPQPTQQELTLKAEEARFSRTVDIGQLFRTRPLCNIDGKSVVRLSKELANPKLVPFSTHSSQRIKCTEIRIPTASLVVDTAWVRVSRGVTQLECQTGEFAPQTEGMDVYFVEGA